ncbi:aminotransferase class I/II-fold pyridoxal phosphate-dependent enzyme [Pelagibacterium lacus]|uniref:aspartate transaminase n=2 Tax=Pelagibacterium lacus TaxID=2282655 RepID=A0A369W323_9HYPH|nr:aminotransferase class I/II-fold pyridoxal phosphate-dependent enzyme [Pelagibacterium lacus]
MNTLDSKFLKLSTENAPGQEGQQMRQDFRSLLRGDVLPGRMVDFSHGDVDAFLPSPGAYEAFKSGFRRGGAQAYTEYRGNAAIRTRVAQNLAAFTGAPVDGDDEMIITPGTQGALFLAIAATVNAGTKVAVIEPDYFANRKLVHFFGAELMPIALDYAGKAGMAGLDLGQLEDALKAGAQVFVFSNPNNPTGVIYSAEEITSIADLAARYDATVIVDQLYSRLVYDSGTYTHLRAVRTVPANLITIMGPSKTESLSGFRLGIAFGSPQLIRRMEQLQAIVSLRAAGYSQAVLEAWFTEPSGWINERTRLHQAIRDDLLELFGRVNDLRVRVPDGGSYLFPELPDLSVSIEDFARILRHQGNVIVTPGSEFGPTSHQGVRLNFSQDHEAAVRAVERMIELIGRYRE